VRQLHETVELFATQNHTSCNFVLVDRNKHKIIWLGESIMHTCIAGIAFTLNGLFKGIVKRFLKSSFG
jgi:hypothetical protein